MGRSSETFNKKDVRNKQIKKRKEKAQRKQEKKEQGKKNFDDMIAWVDENGNLTSTPTDVSKKKEVKAETIEIGIPKAEFRVNTKIKTGRLQNFDESKGFGFIIESGTKESIFVHCNDCLKPLKVGDIVEFEIEKGVKGLKAVNAKPAEE